MADDEQAAALRKSTTPATMGQLAEVAAVISEAVQRLTRRVAELEKTPFTYDGVYEAGKTYRKGTFVTRNGLWHANYTTAARPGDGPAWTLAVKAGRDGRDAA